jgi:hypothetical protein
MRLPLILLLLTATAINGFIPLLQVHSRSRSLHAETAQHAAKVSLAVCLLAQRK